MGKRELLLIAGFVVLGVVVYQATVPPAPPGEQGFSLSRIFDNIRREMREHSASVRLVNTSSHAVDANVTELRLAVRSSQITIAGNAQDAIQSELSVHSTGENEAEARQLASETVLQFERTGHILFARVHFPEGGRQTTGLTLTVPSRLRVRFEATAGKLQASNLAGVELAQARGETTVEDVTGAVTIQHRGGELRVNRVGSLELTARGSTVRIAGVKGAASLNAQAGELTATGLAGPIELETTGARAALEELETTTGIVRVTAVAGEVTLSGIATETQIDARSAELRLAMHRPAVVTVIAEAGGSVRVSPPSAGYRLNAETRTGRILVEPAGLLGPLAVVAADAASGQRVAGDVNGGGPLMTIRARGDITFAK